jgi:hypothetical protein
MDSYRFVLFLHLCALLGAIGTSSLVHFSELRLRTAETVSAARTWASLIARAARVFPVALAVLLGSGAYLVDRGWSWSSGWIVAGLVGVAVLFAVGGGVAGSRSRALARELSAAADGPLGERTVRLTRRHPAAVASWMNTGLALGIVFIMTTKLALAGSLIVLAAAAGLGALLGLRLRHRAIGNG